MDIPTIIILLTIGSAAGILAGIFGIGGGVIIVPALILVLGFSEHKAIGTSLAVLLPPIGIAAFVEYYHHQSVDLPAALIIAAAAIIGAWLGALMANRLSAPMLRFAFGVFIMGLGIYLVYGAMKKLGWA